MDETTVDGEDRGWEGGKIKGKKRGTVGRRKRERKKIFWRAI